jgi:hypothetical protein
LGAKVYQLLGSTHSSWQNTKLTYWENGVYSTDSADLLETSQGKVRFPVLFDFNKELTEGDLAPVRGQWVHQVTEEDVALKAAWDGHVGDYVDYELSTGGLPQSAKDAAVPDLVAFFDLRPPAQGGDDDGGDTPGGDDNGGDTPGGNNSGDNTPGGNNPGTNNPGNTDPGTTNPGTTNPGIVPPVTTPNTDANQPPAGEGKTTLAPVKLRPTVTAKFNKTYTKITVTVKTKAGKGTGKLKVVYKKAGKTKVKYLKLTKGKATYTVTGLKKGQKVRVTYLGTAQVEKKTTSITKK